MGGILDPGTLKTSAAGWGFLDGGVETHSQKIQYCTPKKQTNKKPGQNCPVHATPPWGEVPTVAAGPPGGRAEARGGGGLVLGLRHYTLSTLRVRAVQMGEGGGG